MEFSVASQAENGLTPVILRDANSGTQVSILPEYGAMLHAFTVATPQGMHNIIDNYKSPEEIKNTLSLSYKSSKLSPFACRIPGGKYDYAGRSLELENKFIDGTAIHGLLYNKPFKQTNAFQDPYNAGAVFQYHYQKEDRGYPFEYSCEIRYTLLLRNRLQVQTTITNLDHQPIPVVDGWHPYFTLGGKADNWLLYFDAAAMVEFDATLVPTGRLLPYNTFHTPRVLGNTAFDNCFVLNARDNSPACLLQNKNNGLRLSFFPGADYPYLQLYIPPHRQSIAIENLSGAPNAFNNHMGLLMLQPRQSHTFTLHYQVDCQ